MTAFEQAWALLKSIDAMKDPNNAAMKNNPDYYYNTDFEKWMYSPLETRDNDEDYWHHRIQTDYDPDNNKSLAEIAEEVGFGPIESSSESVISRGPHAGMTEDEYWEMIENMPNERRIVNESDGNFDYMSYQGADEEDSSPRRYTPSDNWNPEEYVSTDPIANAEFEKWFNNLPPPAKTIPHKIQTLLPIDNLDVENKIIDGKFKKPIGHRSLKPITPLEERVPKRPPVSHIEWNPNKGIYTLRGTGGESLSSIKPGIPMGPSPFPDMPIMDYFGETPREFQRKKYYDKLMRGLLNAGIDIQSDNRNFMSQAFHRKFLDNLPPNIDAVYRTNDNNEINQHTPISYSRKPMFKPTSELYEALGKTKRMRAKNRPEIDIALSDLERRDYGALPIQTIPPENVREPIGSYQSRLGDFQNNDVDTDALAEKLRIQNLFGGNN